MTLTPRHKGLIVAGLHCALVLGIGGKLLYDRATRPRQWVLTAPYNPNLPIRGRYVRLRLIMPDRTEPQPIAFFIPEHAPDPSLRKPGEELWAEVTIPKKGPPRPIRLGIKKDGVLTPLTLQ